MYKNFSIHPFILSWLLICVALLDAKAQHVLPVSAQSHLLGVTSYPGFLIAHREDSKNLEAHTLGIELSYKRKIVNESWATPYKDPTLTYGLMYMDLGQPELTGKVFAFLAGFETSIVRWNKSQLRFKGATGIGYLTRTFDVYVNRRNQAIGSHFNGAMQLMFTYQRNVGNKGVLEAGFGITHFSNGSFRVPNLGVNMPSLTLGYHLKKWDAPSNFQKDTLPIMPWQIYGCYAFKERSLIKPTGFNVFNLGITRILARTHSKNWRLGAEVFTDKTHFFIDHPDDDLSGIGLLKMLEFGVYGGHQWQLGQMFFKTDLGFYLYKPSSHKFFTYQRLGMSYFISPKVFLQANLKTHFGIADHFTWGIGMQL